MRCCVCFCFVDGAEWCLAAYIFLIWILDGTFISKLGNIFVCGVVMLCALVEGMCILTISSSVLCVLMVVGMFILICKYDVFLDESDDPSLNRCAFLYDSGILSTNITFWILRTPYYCTKYPFLCVHLHDFCKFPVVVVRLPRPMEGNGLTPIFRSLQYCQFHHRRLELLEHFNVLYIYIYIILSTTVSLFGPYGCHINIFYTLHVCYVFNVNLTDSFDDRRSQCRSI